DGYRIVARVDEGEVQLISRNGKDWTKEFPEVARAVGRLPAGTALLPGAGAPLVYLAFDLLPLDGWDLRPVALEERKEVLRRILEKAPAAIRFSDHVRGRGREFFEAARQAGREGVVRKR